MKNRRLNQDHHPKIKTPEPGCPEANRTRNSEIDNYDNNVDTETKNKSEHEASNTGENVENRVSLVLKRVVDRN